MSFGDKIEHKAEEAVGAGKEHLGDATDNERLETEGRADQGEAHVKQAGDSIKDAASKAKDALTG